MRRRLVLTAVATGAATIAGCTSERATDDTNEGATDDTNERATDGDDGTDGYEPCELSILSYARLPEAIKDEVDVALKEGQYATEGELLWSEISGPELEALKKDDSYYTPIVDRNGVKETTLQFKEITPQYDETITLPIYNSTDKSLEISVTVKDGGRTVLEETDLTLQELTDPTLDEREPEGESGPLKEENLSHDKEIPIGSEYGEYTVEITVEDQETISKAVELGGASRFDDNPDYILVQEGSKEQSFSVEIITIEYPMYDPAACPWEH